jgi:Tachylectin
MPWIGRKKIAFVPVYRPNAHPPDQIPPDWENAILQRVLYDPNPVSGRDRSLRAYIHTVSSGRADLDAIVTPMQTIDQQDVPPTAFESQLGPQLRDQGCDAAAIVMLGGLGAGTNSGFWSRFVMLEGVGTWAMELMHGLTGFTDLYPFGDDADPQDPVIGTYDQMSCACATHPSAYTKAGIQWIEASTIAEHGGRVANYALHPISLTQPPPSGRVAAVKIGSGVPYLMVEARLKADQFDANIPAPGVIVYKVQTTDTLGHRQNHLRPLVLQTPSALGVGQSSTSDFGVGVCVSVTGALPGGFLVKVDDRNAPYETGQLLFYRDTTRNGTGDVNTPGTIGMGGWQQFLQLFSGGDGIIYAVNTQGQLLFYKDWHRDGSGDVSSPSVIGQGGWQQMLFLFAGDPGVIYAVNHDGQLLFYRDQARDGTGDVNTPSVIGQGGWQQFRKVFYGGEGIIYAVNQQGQLLFYRDQARDGTGDVNTPSVIGQGGWQQFIHLFSGGDGIIYAVNQQGQLLFYRDQTRDGTGDVNTPSVIGLGGWQDMKFLFDGGSGIIYAVPK